MYIYIGIKHRWTNSYQSFSIRTYLFVMENMEPIFGSNPWGYLQWKNDQHQVDRAAPRGSGHQAAERPGAHAPLELGAWRQQGHGGLPAMGWRVGKPGSLAMKMGFWSTIFWWGFDLEIDVFWWGFAEVWWDFDGFFTVRGNMWCFGEWEKVEFRLSKPNKE